MKLPRCKLLLILVLQFLKKSRFIFCFFRQKETDLHDGTRLKLIKNKKLSQAKPKQVLLNTFSYSTRLVVLMSRPNLKLHWRAAPHCWTVVVYKADNASITRVLCHCLLCLNNRFRPCPDLQDKTWPIPFLNYLIWITYVSFAYVAKQKVRKIRVIFFPIFTFYFYNQYQYYNIKLPF